MPWGLLQNGDKYSVTTSKHQSIASQFSKVIIPFSILQQICAGSVCYYKDKIELIAQEKARYDEIERINPKTGEKEIYTERRPEGIILKIEEKYFLCSMDGQNYFASELPCKAETVQDGFDSLIPEEVKNKESQRQGEWFFIPYEKKEGEKIIIEKGTKKEKYNIQNGYDSNYKKLYIEKERKTPIKFLQNKNSIHLPHHYATEYGISSKNPSLILVRGSIKHTQRDHRVLQLGHAGKGIFYQAIESNHVQSWGANGRID
jgi:hypothetical protein